ncbi:MAG: amidohydrolase [Chitinophagales bacterium]
MNSFLHIGILQTNITWENVAQNLVNYAKKLQAFEGRKDLDIIVLPEMFTTGFTMKPKKVAENMNGQTMRWLSKWSKRLDAAITGSFVVSEAGKYFNRLVFMRPDGNYETYDKKHLFRMGNEHKVYEAGNERLIVEYKGWRICPLICYDLRFPVFSRNIEQQKSAYDCLIYVANWPQVRNYAWQQLLIGRAIENQAYTIGVNRVGEDGKGKDYSGDSLVLNFRGEKVWQADADSETMILVSLSKARMNEYRTAFPAYLDADNFNIVA